jgi:hypothetical protein
MELSPEPPNPFPGVEGKRPKEVLSGEHGGPGDPVTPSVSLPVENRGHETLPDSEPCADCQKDRLLTMLIGVGVGIGVGAGIAWILSRG